MVQLLLALMLQEFILLFNFFCCFRSVCYNSISIAAPVGLALGRDLDGLAHVDHQLERDIAVGLGLVDVLADVDALAEHAVLGDAEAVPEDGVDVAGVGAVVHDVDAVLEPGGAGAAVHQLGPGAGGGGGVTHIFLALFSKVKCFFGKG